MDYRQGGHNTYGYDLVYNSAVQITAKTEQRPDGRIVSHEYDYDDRGRLVGVIRDGEIMEAGMSLVSYGRMMRVDWAISGDQISNPMTMR